VIAVDANGADQGPAAVAEGVRRSRVETLLFGPKMELLGAGDLAEIVDAPETIKAGDEPVAAVRSRRDASIVQAAAAVGEGRADALVSAGSTGPTLAAGTISIKRIRGVFRPALAVLLPVPDGPVLLLDAGASVQARPEHLVQFAYMGACFMEACVGVERPRVGLLSVGEESGKGTPEVLAAHDRLAEGTLDFAGNVEGFDLPRATVDVVVADGFSGNVALKAMEGALHCLSGAVRAALPDDAWATVAPVLEALDPETYGGAMLLGVEGVCVIGHGASSATAVANGIVVAAELARGDLVSALRSAIAA
jgi:phosphate acyltransferase